MTGPVDSRLAAEFPPGLEWINTSRPLSLAEMAGKFVLIEFWTSC